MKCEGLISDWQRTVADTSRRFERVEKFKLSGDDAPVRCHSERSEESRSVFLPLRTELRARFLASLGMTAPVEFFTPSLCWDGRRRRPRNGIMFQYPS